MINYFELEDQWNSFTINFAVFYESKILRKQIKLCGLIEGQELKMQKRDFTADSWLANKYGEQVQTY